MPDIQPNEYKCAACGGIFEKGWSDEEAAAEADALFSKEELKNAELVCDDCYNMIFANQANLN